MKNLLILLLVLFISCKNKNNLVLASAVYNTVDTNNNYALTIAPLDYNSNESVKTTLYKGTLKGSIIIWLYIKEQEHPCGGTLTIIDAMYKYNNQEKWLLLNVTTDKSKKNYCFVEDNFTGVLFLEAQESAFSGSWISPDTKNQFKVELQRVELDKETNENLEEILFDDLLYNKNDC